ncbi:MAG: imidazoleglycerol-phosphate dehydratase HisB [Cyclonatronaceae bacterium]
MPMLIHLEDSSLLRFSSAGQAPELRPLVLRGLLRLHEAGHRLRVPAETALPADTLRLFEQQGLVLEHAPGETPQPADVRISGHEEGLIIEQTRPDTSGGVEAISKTYPDWNAVAQALLFPPRKARVQRITKETTIEVALNLDGSGAHEISTGVGFYDHMLEQIARHGGVDLALRCTGDLHIDAHHTIEDTALALGEAIRQALGEKRGITRYASCILPMDETRATVALDLSGRPYLVFDAQLRRDSVGEFPTEMTHHFFYSLAMNMKATLHAEVLAGNDHHQIEALFKAFAISLKQAVRRTGSSEIPSSKGVL